MRRKKVGTNRGGKNILSSVGDPQVFLMILDDRS
jgi:hypothetical protein